MVILRHLQWHFVPFASEKLQYIILNGKALPVATQQFVL
jgi:hypothetical protein